MTANGWFQIGLYLFVILLITKPMGVFITRVFNREKTFLDPVLRPVEKLIYRLTGVDASLYALSQGAGRLVPAFKGQ